MMNPRYYSISSAPGAAIRGNVRSRSGVVKVDRRYRAKATFKGTCSNYLAELGGRVIDIQGQWCAKPTAEFPPA